jgi:hypothetical protein
MALSSARFAGVDRLERCLAGDSAARLVPSTNGDFVGLVQQALIDLGESLPQFGADNDYGAETVAAVLSYKTRHDIRTDDGVLDGIVGPKTIAKLDEECLAMDQVPGPCPPPSDGPAVDLGGADEQLVNLVLAETLAARLVGVDGDGATRLLTDGVAGTEPLAAALASAAAAVLVPDRPDALGLLTGSLAQLADLYANAGDGESAQAFAAGAAWSPMEDTGPALAAFLTDQLSRLVMGGGTPVRDLTKAAALTIAASHHALGDIVLSPAPTIAADGSTVLPDPKAKFTIAAQVAGVTYRFTNFADKRLPSFAPATVPLIELDIRHVVGLVRTAQHLRTTWGVTEIFHIGIGGSPTRLDCHGNGRATDFGGAAGVHDGTPFTLTVFNDWKNRSVPNLAHPAKPRLPDWPEVSGPIEYRLATLPGADPLARDFFADLYAWVASEYQDRTEGPGQVDVASTIGRGSRIMTPDHPDSAPLPSSSGRQAHHSHMHWQVGPTGNQAP